MNFRLLSIGLCSVFAFISTQAHATSFHVVIQPIQICQSAGVGCANSGQQLFTTVDNKIWSQAGIDLVFLPWNNYNNTNYLDLSVGSGGVGTEFFNLATNPTGFGGSSVSTVINMWFANLLDSNSGFFGVTSSVGGRAIAIGWDAVAGFSASGRLDTIAHEVGHSLGLDHTTFGAGDPNNLLTSGATRSAPSSISDIAPNGANLDQLNAAQIAQARSSNFAVAAVPEPSSLALVFASGGAWLLLSRRKMSSKKA